MVVGIWYKFSWIIISERYSVVFVVFCYIWFLKFEFEIFFVVSFIDNFNGVLVVVFLWSDVSIFIIMEFCCYKGGLWLEGEVV